MALLKYLKLNPKRLPHPSGPISTVVPTSSIAAANEKVKEIVKEENKKERGPCGRSAEYRLVPVILQVIVPPRRKNEEQIDDIRLHAWPTVTLPPATIGKFFPYSCIPYGTVVVVSTYLKTYVFHASER